MNALNGSTIASLMSSFSQFYTILKLPEGYTLFLILVTNEDVKQ